MLLEEGSFAYYAAGVLLMFWAGIAVGNYATSLVYRIPRGLKIANDPPYCECDKRMYLAVRDLFPFFSWIANKGQCRFCDIRIPAVYTIMEFLCGFLFVMMWLEYGISEELILVLAIDVFFITLAAMHFNESKLFPIIIVILAAFGAVYRTLLDGTIYGFIMTGYWGLMLGVVVWCIEMLLSRRKIPFPDYVIVLALGAMCVQQGQFLSYFIIAFLIAVLCMLANCVSERFKKSAWVLGITFSVLTALSHG